MPIADIEVTPEMAAEGQELSSVLEDVRVDSNDRSFDINSYPKRFHDLITEYVSSATDSQGPETLFYIAMERVKQGVRPEVLDGLAPKLMGMDYGDVILCLTVHFSCPDHFLRWVGDKMFKYSEPLDAERAYLIVNSLEENWKAWRKV